jgi:hypothetical protein
MYRAHSTIIASVKTILYAGNCMFLRKLHSLQKTAITMEALCVWNRLYRWHCYYMLLWQPEQVCISYGRDKNTMETIECSSYAMDLTTMLYKNP